MAATAGRTIESLDMDIVRRKSPTRTTGIESISRLSASHDHVHQQISVTVVSINYAPEVTGIGVYSTGMAEYLSDAGRRVIAITAFPYYPGWRKQPQDRRAWFRREQRAKVDLRRSYLYVPRRPGVLQRMAHELSFVLSASLSYLFAPRTDVTVIVSPPLFLGIPIALIARLKRSRVLFHVQDLQPDAAVDLGMLKRGAMTQLLFALERWTYGLAHRVSAISPSMLKKIASKGVPAKKLTVLRNWANDDLVSPLPPEASLRQEWQLGSKFVVLYAGNMGVKQGLDQLLEVAKNFLSASDVVFVLVGDGGEKPALLEQARLLGLGNMVFHPLQPVERLSNLLATADVSVIPQRPGVTDIVLPSKLPNLMASAKPVVVMADAGTELYREVTSSGCGVAVAPGDVAGMTNAIAELKNSAQRRCELGRRGRAYALNRLSREEVLGEFDRWLANWVRGADR